MPSWKYPEEYRRDAVALVRSSGRRPREIARELGANNQTLRGWVNAANRAEHGGRGGGEPTADERQELRRLPRKVAELELDKSPRRNRRSWQDMGR